MTNFLQPVRRAPAQPFWLDISFHLAIALKGIDGVLEITGALLLAIVTPATLSHMAILFAQPELAEDPHDVLARALLYVVSHLLGNARLFATVYLLVHGVIKVALAVALLRNQVKAYPAIMGVLGALIIYQLYRYSHTHSLALLAFTLFDVAITYLVWREYQVLKGEAV
jgi:uncharacterized membrane protein